MRLHSIGQFKLDTGWFVDPRCDFKFVVDRRRQKRKFNLVDPFAPVFCQNLEKSHDIFRFEGHDGERIYYFVGEHNGFLPARYLNRILHQRVIRRVSRVDHVQFNALTIVLLPIRQRQFEQLFYFFPTLYLKYLRILIGNVDSLGPELVFPTYLLIYKYL